MRGAWLVSLGLAGCAAPPPEGDRLGNLSAELFRDFDENPARLIAELTDLAAELEALDLEGELEDRTFLLPPLQAEDHADVPGGKYEPGDQVTVGVAAASPHDVGQLMTTVVEEDQVCINADAVGCHRRELLSDGACFVDALCEDLRTDNVMLVKGGGVKVWLDFRVDFRWVTLSDGRPAVISRSWMPDEATSEGGGATWKERFGLDVFVPASDDLGRTVRWYATWTSVDLPFWIGRDLYRNALRDGIDDGFENPDRWIDGEECEVKIPDECDFPS